jgi:hypothetical protein
MQGSQHEHCLFKIQNSQRIQAHYTLSSPHFKIYDPNSIHFMLSTSRLAAASTYSNNHDSPHDSDDNQDIFCLFYRPFVMVPLFMHNI